MWVWAQVVERESELRDYQSKLDHDRKKVESANASRKTDQAKMEYAAAEVRVEADKVEQRLEEQLRSLRRQLAEAQSEAAVDFDIKRSEVADETAKQWEAKMAKAIAATEKKEAVRYNMLKEDYDEMVTTPRTLWTRFVTANATLVRTSHVALHRPNTWGMGVLALTQGLCDFRCTSLNGAQMHCSAPLIATRARTMPWLAVNTDVRAAEADASTSSRGRTKLHHEWRRGEKGR